MLDKEYIYEMARQRRMLSLLQKKGGIVRMGGGSTPDYGLLSSLLNQAGNKSANIKIKLAATQVPATYGGWQTGTNYNLGEIRSYPLNSPVMWKTILPISGAPNNATPPALDNPDWQLLTAIDMIQDSGDGVHFFRSTLQHTYDEFVRVNNFQYGTYADAKFLRANTNYETFAQIGTAADAISCNTAIPSAKSFTTQTGLTQLYDSVTLNASFSSTFSIPTVHPNITTYSIGTGLTIAEGDTLTFYGNASNFFVFTVYKYNSLTGVVSGFSTMHVGSGSFSTWTVKKEVLLYFKWTGGAVQFYCLLQTYNSGTGASTANLIFTNAASGSLSGWNISYGKRPAPLTTSQSTNFNVGGQNLAVWFTGEFTGTSLTHRSVKSTAATGWTYIYISGPSAGTPNVTIDLYNGTTITAQSTVVFDNLAYGTHRFVAVAITSPSGLSTNTAPFVYGSTNVANFLSYQEQVNYDLFTPTVNIGLIDPQSAGEQAWRFKLNGSAHTTQWFPYHGVMTGRGISKSFVVDGVTIDVDTISSAINPYLYKYQDFTTATLNQTGAIIHPQDAGDFANYSCIHYFDRSGLYYDLSVEWLKATYIETGYNNQVSLAQTWFQKIKSESGVYMNRPADNVVANMASDFKNQTSYLFYSTSLSADLKDLVLAQYWPDVLNWRGGLPNAGTSFVQDFSGTAGAKFYPLAYVGYVTTIGEVTRIQARHYLGKWIDANTNL